MSFCLRLLNRVLTSSLIWLALGASALPAYACRQALILGLDVSHSVDRFDFKLQRDGLAAALVDKQVVDAMIGAMGNRVELAVFEWSGQSYQSLLIDWTVIDSPETLARISSTLAQSTRSPRSGRTALGSAMLFARDLLITRKNCATRTLDISGDGKNNGGILPEMVKKQLDDAGVVVNGLVIGPAPTTAFFGEYDVSELGTYFLNNVIVGPSSFVETVVGFENYAKAIKRKLLREVVPSLVQRDVPLRNRPL